MSLETLLEAAEFLEWNKAGKKSRATRTSRKAEKFKPYVINERKKKVQAKACIVNVVTAPETIAVTTRPQLDHSSSSYALLNDLQDQVEAEADDDLGDDERQKITLKEIRRSIGNRETHNKLEKNRRAHLKECFEELRNELPVNDERRSSNLSTLRSALRLIEQLLSQQRELETEKRRLSKLKNSRQHHMNILRKELQEKGVQYNIDDWIEAHNTSTNSTSTASECGEAMMDTGPAEDTAKVTQGSPDLLTAAAAKAMSDNLPSEASALPVHTLKLQSVSSGSRVIGVSGSAVVQSAGGKGQQNTQVVTVAKVPHADRPFAKIVLAPKVNPAATGSSSAQILHAVNQTQQQQGQVIISSLPSNTANLVVSPSQLAQLQQQQAVSATATTVAGSLTVNVQTGKVIKPLQASAANLNIAPKQLLLITTGGPAGSPQQSVQTIPHPQFSLSAFANMQAIQQSPVIKPAIITGMVPTTGADGTLSYMPVQLTSRTSAVMTPVAARTVTIPTTQNVVDATTATFINSRQILTGAGGVTIVIPPGSGGAAQPVQLMSTASLQQVPPIGTLHLTSRTSSTAASSPTSQHLPTTSTPL